MSGHVGYNFVAKVAGQTVAFAKDINVNIQRSPAESTTRNGGGWKEFLAGLAEYDIDGDQLYIFSNEAYSAILDAIIDGSEVAVEFEDPDGNKLAGTALVTGLKRGESIGDAVFAPFTLKGTGAITKTAATS